MTEIRRESDPADNHGAGVRHQKGGAMGAQMSFPIAALMPTARALADAGIQRAADAADRRIAGWCEAAVARLRTFAKGQAGVWTIEIARMQIQADLDAPHDLRAWGKVVRMASDRGYIERIPGAYFPAASSHGSPKPVWRKGPQA